MYFSTHNHTHYSNIKILDSINRPKQLIDKAIALGLTGICITDHECLSSHIEVNKYAQKIKEKYPDFTIGLGNEIYLVDSRDKGQKYYHFILIAKDEVGHKMLRELSTIAWLNSYFDRGMERTPLLKEELSEVIKKYGKGHLIANTACLGGELSSLVNSLTEAELVDDKETATDYHNKIVNFILYCKYLFEDDFYIECAPADNKIQKSTNIRLKRIAEAFNLKMIFATDSHYLTTKDRWVHKAYLNSKNGEREVDDFYEFSYLMDMEDIYKYLELCFLTEEIDEMVKNTNELKSKISSYSLLKKQKIPKVTVNEYPIIFNTEALAIYPTVSNLLCSKEIQERYWINECLIELKNKNLYNKQYLERLEIEADVIKYIGDKLGECLYSYFNTFKHYIDLFWECGSIVGPGRGSATGFLSNYLLGITQLDPIRWNLQYWRFLNKERVELPDIDIDLSPIRRPSILLKIRDERKVGNGIYENLGLTQVATFGTEGTKSAIQTACRGYRSEEYPNGIDVDIAQYMSSLVPSHRGFLWSLNDVVYGNSNEDRPPVKAFINEVNQYPGLLEIMMGIEGTINKRSSHASGVILYDEDPFDTACFMKTPSGDIITQFSLHDAEDSGDTKYDFLVTEISDKIIECLNLLVTDKVIKDLPLRDLYNKYLHPEVIDTTKKELWEALGEGTVLDVFQFSTGVGLSVAKKLKPQNPIEMTACNASIGAYTLYL